jgi:predicted  nucleic acid-binding Zn-ribbon protein
MDGPHWEEVVKAPNAEQITLLDVQEHDTRLSQIIHRLNSLPQTGQLAELRERVARLRKEVIAAQTIVSDLEREQLKADADVDLVRERSRKDQELLDSGSISDPKQLQSLQSEIESLAARQLDLEDVELEVMERLEGAKAAVVQLTGDLAAAEAEEQQLADELAGLEAEIAEERAKVTSERKEIACDVSADLRRPRRRRRCSPASRPVRGMSPRAPTDRSDCIEGSG